MMFSAWRFPNQERLSVIDVPGIFKSTTEGLTTKDDIELVRNMVKTYMHNPRSVMLAVVPANADLASQEILELAMEADREGDRTLGVLTKPDLVDKGVEPSIIDLVEGRTRQMKLGWHTIRSPGQSELKDVSVNRGALELAFFRSSPWNDIAKDKTGIDTLRNRLREVLTALVQREFPKVQSEIKARLVSCRKRLDELGPERQSSTEHIAYLVGLATRFQHLAYLAMGAMHGADDAFGTTPTLRIAPAIMSRLKTFSDEMTQYGETYTFSNSDVGANPAVPPTIPDEPPKTFAIRKEDDVEDLVDVLQPQKNLHCRRKEQIRTWLLRVFQENRGFELGTFSPFILGMVMKTQSSKWTDITMGFVSDVIVVVHKFINSALTTVCKDRKVRIALINKLSDDLIKRYEKAVACTSFLLKVEISKTPMTLNHYFNENLQKSRQEITNTHIYNNAFNAGHHGVVVRVEHATVTAHSMSNEEHDIQEMHEILKSYYKVSRKTFVDSVCKQAAIHFLLESEESPLALFTPVFVSQFPVAVLEEIAGEALASKRQRAQMKKEIASLAKAATMLSRA